MSRYEKLLGIIAFIKNGQEVSKDQDAFDLAMKIRKDAEDFLRKTFPSEENLSLLITPYQTPGGGTFYNVSRVFGSGLDIANYVAYHLGMSDINNKLQKYISNKWPRIPFVFE